MEAVIRCKKSLGLKTLGHVYEEPIFIPQLDVTLIVAIAYISQPDVYLESLSKRKVFFFLFSYFLLSFKSHNIINK